MRVAVQSTDRLLRELLAGWLDRRPRLVAVGLVGGADDLVALCRAHRPDLVVLEADAPGWDAAALLRLLPGRPRPRTVGLHHASSASTLRRLRGAGFDQLVDFAAGLVSLAEAIDRLSAQIPQTSQAPQIPTVAQGAARGSSVRLTDRELDILRLLGGSLRSAGIAETLGISVNTVENHKRHVFAKLDVHSETHAVARAIREGLLTGLRPAPADLTPREREILSLAAAGYSVKQTAHTLGVSVKTVESIQRHLFCKLGVHGRPGAVAAVYGASNTDLDDTFPPLP